MLAASEHNRFLEYYWYGFKLFFKKFYAARKIKCLIIKIYIHEGVNVKTGMIGTEFPILFKDSGSAGTSGVSVGGAVLHKLSEQIKVTPVSFCVQPLKFKPSFATKLFG